MEQTRQSDSLQLLRGLSAALRTAPTARTACQIVAGMLADALAVAAVTVSVYGADETPVYCHDGRLSATLEEAARYRPWTDPGSAQLLQIALAAATPADAPQPLPAPVSRRLHAEGYTRVAFFPLLDRTTLLGSLALFDRQDTARSRSDLALAGTAADLLTAALSHHRLEADLERIRRQREQDRQRLTFLARAGEMLSYSLDLNTTLRRLARLAVPIIADWCAVDLVQPDGGSERVAVYHRDPERVELAYQLVRDYPPASTATVGVPAVLRTGEPQFYPEITGQMLEDAAQDASHLALLRSLDLNAMIIVPLKARLPREPLVLGTLTLAMSESGRNFTEEDVALATELAQRAALAVDNARLYGQATGLNEELEQRVSVRTRALRQMNRQLKQQIEEARRAEARFRDLLEAAPDPIVIVDEHGAITLVNAQAETVFRYSRDDLLGQPVELLIPSVHRRRHREHRATYLEHPRPRPMGAGLELEAVDSTGRTFPVEVSLSPLLTEEDTRVIAVVRDITARKETEASMRKNEALYRLIAHHIPNGSVLVVDHDLRYRLADGPALRVAGVGPLEGRTPWDVLPEELAEQRAAAYRAALAGTPNTAEMTVDGRTYREQTVPLPREDGTVEAALVLIQDITDLKAAEATARRLLHLSEKLHATLDVDEILDTLTEEGIQLTGATSGFSGLNTPQGLMTRHYFHEGRKYLLNKTWQAGEGIPGRLLNNTDAYLTNDTLGDEQISVFADSFGVRSLVCVPILNRRGHLLGFLEVTNKAGDAPFTADDQEKLNAVAQIAAIGIENAQSYARMRRLSREIVSAQEAERRRLSRDLHDSAGQLLTVLKLNLSLLVDQQTDSTLRAQLAEAVEIADQTHEEIRATSQALRPPTLEMVGLDETLRTLCNDFGKQASLHIEYQGEAVPALPDQAGISFYRFLQEALTNIARHAQATSARVRLLCQENEISLTVEDDGIGMAAPHRLYTTGSGKGVGLLGLRERFELIGGRVEIASNPGHGTRIISRYPLPADDEEQ